MRSLFRLLQWLDTHLLFVLSLFLLAFIPLFPKIPLFDALPGYIVKVRAEDFIVGLTALVWIREVWKKRIQWNTVYFWFVLAYICAGLLSILFGIILLGTIPLQLLHIGKSGLTFFRYLEYFSLFFFLSSAIRTKRRLLIALGVIILTLVGVIGYGFGQKYARFPAFSTMNREYSKGTALYLSPGDKVQSTFAGHYDLAAYLAIILPLIFALSLGVPLYPRWKKILWFLSLQGLHASGVLLLLLSGSATSLIGYGVGITLTVLLFLFRLPSWRQRVLWGGTCILLACVALGGVWVIAPPATKEKISHVIAGSSRQGLPQDLVGDGMENKVIETAQPDGSVKSSTIRVKSDWSANALKYGITMGIRLDTLWPEALLGLARSPITGSGYGTLATADTGAFTEADSTDNNFLRTLGETGFFGSIIFYGFVLFVLREIASKWNDPDPLTATLSIGWTGAGIGLLIAALTLDVFAASKVAFTFWALSGTLLSTQMHSSLYAKRIRSHLARYGVLYVGIGLTVFFLHQNPFLRQTPVNDISQSLAGLKEITSARCFLSHGSFTLCRNSGLTNGSHHSLVALLLVPLYRMTSVYGVFAYLTLIVVVTIQLGTFLLLRKKIQSWSFLVASCMVALFGMVLHITEFPRTSTELVGMVLAEIILLTIVSLVLSRIRILPRAQYGVIGLSALATCVVAIATQIPVRFQNLAPNDARSVIRLANAYIHHDDEKQNYFISGLNPYFSDLYALNAYTLLPLSRAQPYGNSDRNVWEAVFSPDLLETSHVYVTDFDAQHNDPYARDFSTLKKSYDLSYLYLGCDERCNILQVSTPSARRSVNPVSILPTRQLTLASLPESYDFAVVSNVFSPNIQNQKVPPTTLTFSKKLEALTDTTQQFAVITGDAVHVPEKTHADFITSVAQKSAFPILYSRGNDALIPTKYFPGEFMTFFTQKEYFLLLPTDPDSHLSLPNRLALYNALLRLEKLPSITNVIIVSHDLNWQDTSDPENALFTLERKLHDFPNLHTTIITANHKKDLLTATDWFDTKTEGNITYGASLTAGSTQDTYIQVHVRDGHVSLEPKRISP